jgi:hypothetical protein
VQEATQRLAIIVLGLPGNAGLRNGPEAGVMTISHKVGEADVNYLIANFLSTLRGPADLDVLFKVA